MRAAATAMADAAPADRTDGLDRELAQAIVESLDLPDVDVASLAPETPLYGEGLGLDSIDILEVALMVSRRYGFELRSDDPDNEQIFRTLGSLAQHVRTHRSR